MDLIATTTQSHHIGKAAIFRQPVWDGTTDLFPSFVHIGTTEGDVDIANNAEYAELTLPESTGPAAIRRMLSGERPSFELGVFPTTEARLKLFSPTGLASAGGEFQRAVEEHTLWIVPQQLFLKENAQGFPQRVSVAYAAGAWTKDGAALSAEDQRLLDLSIIIWRADFTRATTVYRHGDAGKALKSVTVNCQQDFTKPDGCQLYLVMGEASEFPTLDFEP